MSIQAIMTCDPVSFADANFSAYCADDDQPVVSVRAPFDTETATETDPVCEPMSLLASPELKGVSSAAAYETKPTVRTRAGHAKSPMAALAKRLVDAATQEGRILGAVLSNAVGTTLDHVAKHRSSSEKDSVDADSH